MASRTSTRDPDWVSLTEARELLGVSASTIRRWADTGLVRTFVTPGGHRRFSRAGLETLLPQRPAGHPTLVALGETASRMARGYRRASTQDPSRIPWVVELDDARRERFRAYGRGIVSALMAALDATDPATRADRLRAAEEVCTEYGAIAAGEQLGAPMTAELFLRFRRPFVAELAAVAARRELDAPQTSALLGEANAALDGLLLATLRGWETGFGAVGRPTVRRNGAKSPTGNGAHGTAP